MDTRRCKQEDRYQQEAAGELGGGLTSHRTSSDASKAGSCKVEMIAPFSNVHRERNWAEREGDGRDIATLQQGPLVLNMQCAVTVKVVHHQRQVSITPRPPHTGALHSDKTSTDSLE